MKKVLGALPLVALLFIGLSYSPVIPAHFYDISPVVNASVVDVDGGRYGTCFPISSVYKAPHYYTQFLSACHVLSDVLNDTETRPQHKITITVYNGWAHLGEYPAKVLRYSTGLDVAILVIETPAELRVCKIRGYNFGALNPAELRPGTRILAIGFPLDEGPHVSEGFLGRKSSGSRWLSSAPVAPGNSGGPVLDYRTGEVLGIVVAIKGTGFSLVWHLSYIVPISEIVPWLKNKTA